MPTGKVLDGLSLSRGLCSETSKIRENPSLWKTVAEEGGLSLLSSTGHGPTEPGMPGS